MNPAEADACTERGSLCELLRREGLYVSEPTVSADRVDDHERSLTSVAAQ
jgi:hypothetical protein